MTKILLLWLLLTSLAFIPLIIQYRKEIKDVIKNKMAKKKKR